MSKLLLLLVTIFVVAIGLFIFITFSFTNNSVLRSIPILNKTPAQDQTTLAITPSVLAVTPGQPTSVSIVFTTKSHTPKLIQLEIAYEPNALADIEIHPGNYFIKAAVSLNTVNPRIGRISYAIEATENSGINKDGNVVATISFTPWLSAYKKQTTLYFLPKTAIRADDDSNSLKAAYGTTISLSQPSVAVVTQPAASSPATIQQIIKNP